MSYKRTGKLPPPALVFLECSPSAEAQEKVKTAQVKVDATCKKLVDKLKDKSVKKKAKADAKAKALTAAMQKSATVVELVKNQATPK